MICPACGLEQPQAAECHRCGLIIARYKPRNVRAPVVDPRQAAPVDGPAAQAGSGSPAPAQPQGLIPLSLRERQLLFIGLQRGLRSGLTLQASLGHLAGRRGRLGPAAARLSQALEGGASLGVALDRVVRAPGLATSLLVRAGEETGRLDATLGALAAWMETARGFRRKLLSPLLYPSLVVFLACFLMPIPALVTGSAWSYALEVLGGLALLGLVAALPWLAGLALQRVPGAAEACLGLPGGRDLHRAVVAFGLQHLLATGYPLKAGLALLRDVHLRPANRERFQAVLGALERGESFTDALGRAGLFPADDLLALATAEGAGALDEALGELAARCRERLAAQAKVMATVASVLLSLAMFGALAMKIVAQFRAATGGTEDLIRQIEAETPIRGMEQLLR
jgi:type II secretory pathway component PulF